MEDSDGSKMKIVEEFLRFLDAHDVPLEVGCLVDPPYLKALLKIQIEKGDKTLLNLLLKFREAEEKFLLIQRQFNLAKSHPWLFGKELLEETLRTMLKYEFTYVRFLVACYKEDWKEAEAIAEKLNSLASELDQMIKKLEEKVM